MAINRVKVAPDEIHFIFLVFLNSVSFHFNFLPFTVFFLVFGALDPQVAFAGIYTFPIDIMLTEVTEFVLKTV